MIVNCSNNNSKDHKKNKNSKDYRAINNSDNSNFPYK